jgi:Tol biopolymer transport system component
VYALILLVMMSGCSSAVLTPSTTSLYVFRQEPPALVELSANGRLMRELPVAIPAGCRLESVYAPPVGAKVAIEYGCEFGPAVLYVNTESGEVWQPVTDSDSHFMAWTPDGQAAYLKVDTVNRPHIVLATFRGKPRSTPITELTYDLSPKAGTADFLFSFSRGLGEGSEMWYARDGGRSTRQTLADSRNYLSFARWSPDGRKIAFIKIPDSSVPFSVGELWVMNADGSGARKFADADAGHGYAEAWSPDGSRIAFVMRDNPQDANADQNAAALRSSIGIVSVNDGARSVLTHFPDGRVEAPAWSPDGNRLAFTVVLNDKMNIYIADVDSGRVVQASAVPSCCPVWIRK